MTSSWAMASFINFIFCAKIYRHTVITLSDMEIIDKHYHETPTLINNVMEKIDDAYNDFCQFEKQFENESRS